MPKTPLATIPEFRASHWTAETARAVLAAQRQSGECLTQFAREHGLHPQRLFWWRKRLDEEDAAAEGSRPLLVPVITRPAAPEHHAETAPLRLRVGEVQLDFPDAAALPPTWLAALVRALGVQR
jgi:transposase-like protein